MPGRLILFFQSLAGNTPSHSSPNRRRRATHAVRAAEPAELITVFCRLKTTNTAAGIVATGVIIGMEVIHESLDFPDRDARPERRSPGGGPAIRSGVTAKGSVRCQAERE